MSKLVTTNKKTEAETSYYPSGVMSRITTEHLPAIVFTSNENGNQVCWPICDWQELKKFVESNFKNYKGIKGNDKKKT